VFGDTKFDAVRTNVGIVATKWIIERPMIFKANIAQAHGRQGTFTPGFGVTIGDAVQASCSAYPFFRRKTVVTSAGDHVELVDGGYCANNPTLYAIADAVKAMKVPPENLRIVSVGVGEYPKPKRRLYHATWWLEKLPSVQLAQKMLEINTQSMDQLRAILYRDIATVRINDAYTEPTMATDLFEHNFDKLNVLRQRGVESYAKHEPELRNFLM
jgi:patatin-like phospholipase/acyl hydrolase